MAGRTPEASGRAACKTEVQARQRLDPREITSGSLDGIENRKSAIEIGCDVSASRMPVIGLHPSDTEMPG
jgi:hypothetical protein